MGVLDSLAQVQEELAKRPSGSFEEKKPGVWVSLKSGDSVKLTFLNELDEGSPNYSKKNGKALFSLQHSNPDNWKKKAECTADQGDCYGCSRGWRKQIVLYVNALVDNGHDEPFVGIWSKGVASGSVASDLMNIAADTDYDNSITDKVFKFTRTDTNGKTAYSLQALPKPSERNPEDFTDELFDLPKYVFTVVPEKQEAYYLDLKDGQSAPAPVSVGAKAADVNAQW